MSAEWFRSRDPWSIFKCAWGADPIAILGMTVRHVGMAEYFRPHAPYITFPWFLRFQSSSGHPFPADQGPRRDVASHTTEEH